MGPRNAPGRSRYAPTVPAGAVLVLDQAEAELQENVVELADALHLLRYHVPRSDVAKVKRGFPDWVFTGPGGTIFVELKATDGRIRPEQQEWLDLLAEGGETVHIWRPEHWLDGTIARELNRIARRGRRPR
jgi:hypothetical protein